MGLESAGEKRPSKETCFTLKEIAVIGGCKAETFHGLTCVLTCFQVAAILRKIGTKGWRQDDKLVKRLL